jgi:hypothetical protein
MEWYSELEQKLVPIAFQAAGAVSSKVKYAQIEFENGSVAIVIPFFDRLTADEWQAVEDAVRASLCGLVADTQRLKIRLRHEFRYLYTPHLERVRQTPNVLGPLHDILHFPIPASALLGLRQVYELLYTKAKEVDFVATTALGGIPALTFLVRRLEDEEKPSDYNEWPDFFDSLRDKYHLFPGLNWSGTDEEKNRLFEWLSQLPNGASVLLFDTGTSGNGVRQMANLIRERLADATSFGPTALMLIGVVDGTDLAQRESDEVVAKPGGRVRLIVSFERVPRMLTEDCQQLLGYTSLRREMMLSPLSANAVMEITDEEGKVVYSCGALGADSLLRSVIRMRGGSMGGDTDHAAVMNEIISFAVAYISIGKEYTMLRNAFEYGLIDRETAEAIKGRMAKKYAESLGSVRSREWDFGTKRAKRRQDKQS